MSRNARIIFLSEISLVVNEKGGNLGNSVLLEQTFQKIFKNARSTERNIGLDAYNVSDNRASL